VTMSRAAWRPTIALIAIGLLLGACTQAGATPGGSTSTSPGTPSAVASETPADSLEPSPSAGPASSPSQPVVSSLAEPPGASLAVEGGEPVQGQLGTFTWRNAGSDAPWLDGSPIRIGAGERLTLTLGDPVRVANWTASRVPPGNRDGSGAIGMGDGSAEPVAFDAPPPGAWSVRVEVWFSDSLGSASYYWLLNVE
jgi:hypothetical protein